MTASISNEAFSAAHQVLSSPPLLECIFTWVSNDVYGSWPVPELLKPPSKENPNLHDDDEDDEPEAWIEISGVLLRCAIVNKTWFREAIRILWRNWEERILYSSGITETFSKIDHSQRQFYANLIHRAEVVVIGDWQLGQLARTVFQDITFSNLESVQFTVPGHGNDSEVPIFRAPKLKTLLIDPEFDSMPISYSVHQDQWRGVFKIITDRFPDIENLEFVDQAKVWPGEIQKLRDGLPCLKSFNVTGVAESTVVGPGL
ncbi:uncharacterized protein N7496_011092 [Penicillium cataractarum]|uniref:Uncharacterized protein n=1 Tax=Penicillium cataractarum TaxID=2100454 RepID=A0A9W9RG59_9EURO|nr:uncharacterized protein N7496_011092 [Penicillium cataractarum]KAJ5358679.1 hypothetical protein N7496_011092 [Penicillium cataractarum]